MIITLFYLFYLLFITVVGRFGIISIAQVTHGAYTKSVFVNSWSFWPVRLN